MTKSKFIFIIFVVFAFGLGFLVANLTFDVKTQSYSQTRNQDNYHFINPLVDCDSYQPGQGLNLDFLKNEINNIINTQVTDKTISFASVYYRDLNNGPWFGVNQSELFSPASLIKVPVMITYYKLAENDPSILRKKIKFTGNLSNTNQNITPGTVLTPNTEYTIDDLIYRMIAYSDNEAFEILNRNLDGQKIIDTYNEMGIDISQGITNPTGNIISVKSYASFFRILYNASYLNRTYSEKSLSNLSHTEYQKGLIAGIDPSVIVAHKFGERNYTDTGEKQLHDCGIVYVPQKPYLICIMTRGNNFDKLSSSIATISNIVYKTISQK